ncbi:Haspin [Trypoxylus dichotomus]
MTQALVNETIISPIVKLNIEKCELHTTPKLKRISKVRRSKLLCDAGYENSTVNEEDKENIEERGSEPSYGIISEENLYENDESRENTRDNSFGMVSYSKENVPIETIRTNVGEVRQNDTLKDLSKIFQNAAVNLTLLNGRNLRRPFINLTNIELGPFYDDFNQKNVESSVAVLNVTTINFERYLHQLHRNRKDDSGFLNLSKISRRPFVNITNMNIEKYIAPDCCKEENVVKQSVRSNSSCMNQSNDNSSGSGNSSKNNLGQLHLDMPDFAYRPVVNLTRVNLEEFLTSRNNFSNLKEISSSDEENLKDASRLVVSNSNKLVSDCSSPFKGFPKDNSETQTSSMSSENNSEVDGMHLVFTEMKNGTPPYLTLRRRRVPKIIPIKCSKDRSRIKEVGSKPNIAEHSECSGSQNISRSKIIVISDEESMSLKSTCSRIVDIKDMTSEDPKMISADLFESDSFSSYTFEKESSLESKTNGASIIPENNACIVDTSYIDSVCRNIDVPISSLKINKRPRTSQFKQRTSAYREHLVDITESTPIKITKRNKLSYTPKRSVVVIDLGKKSSKWIRRVSEDVAARGTTQPSTSKVSQRKWRNSSKRSDFQSGTKINKIIDQDQETSGRSSDAFAVSKITEVSKRESSSVVKQSDFKALIHQLEVNDQGSVVLTAAKTSVISKKKSKDSLQISDFQSIGQSNLSDQVRGDRRSNVSAVSKTSVISKKEFKDSQEMSDFHSSIGQSGFSDQVTGDRRSNVLAVSKVQSKKSLEKSKPQLVISQSEVNSQVISGGDSISKRESMGRKLDFQPMLNESEINNRVVSNRDSSVFAIPKLPTIKTRQIATKEDEKVVLKPGKLWRRSLLEVRNSKIGLPPIRQSLICVADKGFNSCGCNNCKKKIMEVSTPRRHSIRVVPLVDSRDVINMKSSSILENYAISCRKTSISSNILRESSFENSLRSVSLSKVEATLQASIPLEVTVTAREVVLGKCGQTEPLPFEKCYPNSILQCCQKIGEGVYGEVFRYKHPKSNVTTVIKIIPIEGDQIVNGERQKKFEEVLSEITIALELSNLRANRMNTTNCFNELKKVTCVRGRYPRRLLKLWELYDEARTSENDHPQMFNQDQLYITLELANGGNDMESFVFNNAQQAYSLVTQVACALAVAENALEFEHRDLHWGNVLISSTDSTAITFKLDGKCVNLPTYGIQLAIIDFTLSRVSHDGVYLYNDLALDPDLFTAVGDYQFEIYRLMQKHNGNDWQHYEPYTNILWLHYIIDKTINGVKYRNKTSKIHKRYLQQLKELHGKILQHKNVKEFAITNSFLK